MKGKYVKDVKNNYNRQQKFNIKIERQDTEQVDVFKHLGGIISSEGTLEDEINERSAKTGKLYN